jgi:outer membrane immunogenic protein
MGVGHWSKIRAIQFASFDLDHHGRSGSAKPERTGEISMKKVLFGAIGLAALAAPAYAADLPQRPPPAPAPVVVPYIYDWTGFYIGANGGYGSNRACWGAFVVDGATFNTEGCNSKSGGIFGGQAGYRWQIGGAVFGLELQGDWANLRASIPSIAFPGGFDYSKVTSVGLFTGQIGYAWGPALLYVKGGGAWANNNFTVVNAAGLGFINVSSNRVGGSVGVGFEYGFTPNWSVGVEYDHLMMGSANNSFSCSAGCAAAANTISQNIDMVAVRVNYKFGVSPVVARY